MANDFDPYEIITNMKWILKSDKTETEPINEELILPGTKAQVVQKGILITDNQGRLLISEPNTKLLPEVLNHVWELWIIPEIKRRKDANLPAPFPLKKFFILLDKDENIPIIKFNDEYSFRPKIRMKQGGINKGDPIIFDQILDVINFDIKPVLKDGKPLAFIIFNIEGKQISVYFDFRPNDPGFSINEWRYEGRWLANAWLETLLVRNFGHLALLIPQLSRNDIPFTIGPRSERMKILYEAIDKGVGKDELDNILSMITQNEVESLIVNWLTSDLFSKRGYILREVSKAFKNEIYGGVILLLMSQVEGIITEELIVNNKGLKKNGDAKRWDIRIKEFYEIVKNEEIGPLISRVLDGISDFLKDSNLYQKFSWVLINGDQVNRNACIHGKDTSFNTCANAIRMILLFDALYWIFFAISISRNEKNDINFMMRWI